MRTRVLTVIALTAIGLPAIIYGGIFYFLLMGTFVVGAAWEYVRIFRASGYEPNDLISVGGVFLIILAHVYHKTVETPLFILLVLLAMTVHLFHYEKGRDHAGMDFLATVGALVYLGLIGAFLVDLRNINENGAWWVLTVLPCVWFADSGAYMIGTAYGRHKMAPRLSPKKSWEGYIAGVFTAMFGGALFAYAYSTLGGVTPFITPLQGVLLGLILSTITPLGDFGESMLKRQSGMKDSSNIFPGHGGFFDRIDSWLWGAVIGTYFIHWIIK
jgi:phosphatidate cytidylyltransferase